MAESWRVVLVCTIVPMAEAFTRALRELVHDPVAILSARRPHGDEPAPLLLANTSVPDGLDLLFARDKWAVEPLVRAYEPDLLVCSGFPWKIPQAALEVPRLGAINNHPGPLPRHRGPVPLAWALRDGLPEWSVTWHRMEAELDTGSVLATGAVPIGDDDVLIDDVGPRLIATALELLPGVLERVAAGDPGDPQPLEGVGWAGHFADDDYARIDWSRPARAIHDQVRAWHFTFGLSGVRAPRAELGGGEVVVLQTRLTDPGGDAVRVECGDGPLWVVASEPV